MKREIFYAIRVMKIDINVASYESLAYLRSQLVVPGPWKSQNGTIIRKKKKKKKNVFFFFFFLIRLLNNLFKHA